MLKIGFCFQETPRHLLHHQSRAGKGQVNNKKHHAHKFPNVKKTIPCIFQVLSRLCHPGALLLRGGEPGEISVPIEQFILFFFLMSTLKRPYVMRDNAIKNQSFCTKIQRCFSTHRGTSTKEKKSFSFFSFVSIRGTLHATIFPKLVKINVSFHLLQDESTGEFGRPREECAHKVGHTMHVDIQEFKEVRKGL